jgi:hypothetical protein
MRKERQERHRNWFTENTRLVDESGFSYESTSDGHCLLFREEGKPNREKADPNFSDKQKYEIRSYIPHVIYANDDVDLNKKVLEIQAVGGKIADIRDKHGSVLPVGEIKVEEHPAVSEFLTKLMGE